MPYSIPSSTKILIYFGNSTIFVYFSWHPLSVNLLWCQECTVYCVSRKKRYALLSTHSAAQSSKRFKPVCDHIIMARSLLNWKKKKNNKKRQTAHGTCNLTNSTLKFLFVFDFK